MTKKLDSFSASLASTSTAPRLLFKRNQLEPETSKRFGRWISSPPPHYADAPRQITPNQWPYGGCEPSTRFARPRGMAAICAERSSRIAAVEVAIGGIRAIRARVL